MNNILPENLIAYLPFFLILATLIPLTLVIVYACKLYAKRKKRKKQLAEKDIENTNQECEALTDEDLVVLFTAAITSFRQNEESKNFRVVSFHKTSS